jgi:hypothetical protein
VPALITSERYLSDRYYSKDSLFYHFLRNGSDKPMKVFTQDFFYDCVKPYLHELVISMRSLEDKFNKSVLVRNKDYKVKIDYYNRETAGTAQSIVHIYDIVIPAKSEIVIHFGISKTMI